MNIPLLRRIQRQIDKAPERFDMRDFQGTPTECGTAFCLAGWACVLSGMDTREILVRQEAIKLLDVTGEQGNRLFYQTPWPRQFWRDEYQSESTAAKAIARIEHFIQTEGRE